MPYSNDPPVSATWSPTILQNIDIDYLLSVLKDDIKEGQSVEERSVEPAHVVSSQSHNRQAKICPHWYHDGTCKQDDKSACPFVHSLEPGLPLAKLPMGLKKRHKEACGLELCPRKNGKPEPTVSRKVAVATQPAKNIAQSQPASKQVCWYWYHFGNCTRHDDCSYEHKQDLRLKLQAPPSAHGAHPPQGCSLELCPWKDGMSPHALTSGKKRKGRDDPHVAKRSRLDYDDEPKVGKQENESTCFFWYHGRKCGRSSNPAFSYLCGFKHGLTDPPSIVHVPPQDDHARQPCELEWCASHRLGPAADSSCSVSRHTSEQKANSSERRNNQTKQVKATCFFWYHGHCGRAADPRNKAGCNYLHELTEPPSMVQPPPGYKHQSPCSRPWCPGDAREMLTLKDTTPKDEAQNSGADQGKYDSDDSDDWYLTGFE